MNGIRSIGLLGRIVIILTFVLVSELLVNAFVLERVSRFYLPQPEAQAMAGHLSEAWREMDRTPLSRRAAVARQFSTPVLKLTWQQDIDTRSSWYSLDDLREQLHGIDPELKQAKLRLYLMPVSMGGNVAGSIELTDHSTVTFRTSHQQAFWPLTLGRAFGMLIPAALLALLGGLMIRATLQPLRKLMRATRHVGGPNPSVLPEEGPREMRELIRDFNAMQLRIQRLVSTRTQALAAVGHDLRTPLTRMELTLENATIDPAIRQPILSNINEMVDLLESLRTYLSGEGRAAAPVRLDLAVMASTIVDEMADEGKDAEYSGPASMVVRGRPVAIRRALANLVENALHYAGHARLNLSQDDGWIIIRVDDDGPGIPDSKMEEVLQPFVRLDEGRARNTRGMGLGLSIVDNAIRAEGGELQLMNRSGGGFSVIIRLPQQFE